MGFMRISMKESLKLCIRSILNLKQLKTHFKKPFKIIEMKFQQKMI